MRRIIAKSTIAKLNARARAISRTLPDDTFAYDILRDAAHQFGLDEIKRDDSSILYRNKQRAYVNAWFESPFGQHIKDDGIGFDDQIDWAFE